ncbi:hypothetical protein [Halalkalibacillus halophilus]|uniref:hypothetical protein n=1 Tax=Halalkalibacillus halophilus TaxID=392827 RepID=UPI0003FBA5AB|nr:hypothetical protein [Halalkalibacillus halophilus]
MQKLVFGISGVFFVLTWVVVIWLFVGLDKPTHSANNFSLSEQSALQAKSIPQLTVFNDENTGEAEANSVEQNTFEEMNEEDFLDEDGEVSVSSIEDRYDEASGVSIDEVLDWLEIDYEEAVQE